MSIRFEMEARISEGRLQPLLPTFASAVHRQFLVVPSLLEAMGGNDPDDEVNRRFGEVQAILESFVQGDLIVVRMPPSKNRHCLLALLEPGVQNVWEFRIGQPRPGVRIFGRFAAPNIFIATNWRPREHFTNPLTKKEDLQKWKLEMLRCKSEWTKLFPAYPPLTGVTPNDFLSNSRLLI